MVEVSFVVKETGIPGEQKYNVGNINMIIVYISHRSWLDSISVGYIHDIVQF
jgi:hypothetical protein